MKLLSEYYGSDFDKEAHVHKDGQNFIVRMRNDLGSYFVATFNSLDDAENFAENYVRGETYES
jgi:hypothetical protein